MYALRRRTASAFAELLLPKGLNDDMQVSLQGVCDRSGGSLALLKTVDHAKRPTQQYRLTLSCNMVQSVAGIKKTGPGDAHTVS